MTQRLRRNWGFTLVELMIVLAILSILAATAMVSHRHFAEKAKSVEAEVALAEIDRLEMLYHASHGSFSGDFSAIGFELSPTLKYYKVTVQLQDGGTSFQAVAIPLSGTKALLALVLTHTKAGTALQKADPVTLAGQTGRPIGSSGIHPAVGETSPGIGRGNSDKASCQQGGEATVAQDGLLDMNFCLK